MENAQDCAIRCQTCGMSFTSPRSICADMRHHSELGRHAENAEANVLAPAENGGPVEDGNGCSFQQPDNAIGLAGSSEMALTGPISAVVPESPRLEDRILQAKTYSCNVCDRTFPSYRALGGHNAHHSMWEKKRRVGMEDGGSNSSAACDGGLTVYNYPLPPPQPRPGRHHVGVPKFPCLRCGRSFYTGQGRGAHMRHCKSPPVENQPRRVIHDFDLNKFPPPEEEEVLCLPWHDEIAPQ